MRASFGALVLALVSAGVTASAAAQQPTTTTQMSVEVQRVTRGLEAQFQAALIKERRLADDRELRIIATAEARLRQARSAFDRRISGAEVELEASRAAYAKLVSDIATRDATTRAQIEAYRREAQNLARQSGPELIAAYQRFADGDQETAWPVMKALTGAERRAQRAATDAISAAQARQLAHAREIMRLNSRGGATAQEVLSIWDEAAALDPNDVETHVERARLALSLGLIEDAQAAGELAVRSAVISRDKAAAPEVVGQVQETSYLGAAFNIFGDSLLIRRELQAKDSSNEERLLDVSVSLEIVGRFQHSRYPDLALKSYEESLRIRRELFAKEPDNVERRRDVAISLELMGGLAFQRGDKAEARKAWEEEIVIVQPLMRADEPNLDWPHFIAIVNARLAQLDESGARQHLVEAYGLLKPLAEKGQLLPQVQPLYDALEKEVAGAKTP